MSPEERSSTLRFVLFNVDHELAPAGMDADADDHFDRVRGRFMAALWQHLDDTTDEFNRWFFADADSVIRQISKQVRNGGSIPRDVVREVRLRTILEAYQSMAVCIHVGMRSVQSELPLSMTNAETEYFELLYCRQDTLAGMPLILLRDRLARIGTDPLTCPVEDTDPRVVLRLLCYYAEMVSKRRAADRRIKSPYSAIESPLRDHDQVAAEADDTDEQLEQLAHTIVNIRDLNCDCRGAGAFRITPLEESASEIPDELTLQCALCGWERTVPITEVVVSEIRSRSAD